MEPVTNNVPEIEPLIHVRVIDGVAVATARTTRLGKQEAIDLHGALLVLADQHAGRVVMSLHGLNSVADELIPHLIETDKRCRDLGGMLVLSDLPRDLRTFLLAVGFLNHLSFADTAEGAVDLLLQGETERRVA